MILAASLRNVSDATASPCDNGLFNTPSAASLSASFNPAEFVAARLAAKVWPSSLLMLAIAKRTRWSACAAAISSLIWSLRLPVTAARSLIVFKYSAAPAAVTLELRRSVLICVWLNSAYSIKDSFSSWAV